VISIEDCIAMCGLDPAEIAAIMEHEHVPEIEATGIASDMLHTAGGAAKIRRMLVDDIRGAQSSGNHDHAADLLATLRHFLLEHPEAGANRNCGGAARG
jgi:hypothetical protein